MSIMSFLTAQSWVQRVGWTLIQFLWQGTMVAVLFAIVRGLAGRSITAQARYVLSCSTLAMMVVAPVLTFIASPTVLPVAVWPRSSQELWQPVLPWLVAAWLTGVLLFSMRLIGGWRVTARMRRNGTRPADEEWQQKLADLIVRLRVSRTVQLMVSSMVEVPTIIGWMRPMILVPVGALTGLPAAQMEVLLIHELAHIRRLDYLMNILQSVTEATLFYHPAVWWVSDQIRTERELCCDDLAVAATGDVMTYVCALAELESYRPVHSNRAIAANGGSLPSRIRRLIGQAPPMTHALPGSGAAVVMSVLCLLGMGVMAANGAPRVSPSAAVIQQLQTVEQRAGTPGPVLSTLLFGPLGPSPEPQLESIQMQNTGTVSGIVVLSGTTEGIPKAIVTLTAGNQKYTAMTGDDGRFTISKVPPGKYTTSTTIDSNRYGAVPQRPGPPIFVNVEAGGNVRNVKLELVRFVSLSGKLLDVDGNPADDVEVHLLQEAYFGNGQPYLRASGLMEINEHGEFRNDRFYVAPGEYYVVASSPKQGRAFAPTYYPGVSSIDDAVKIVVPRNQDLNGVTFALSKVSVHSVRFTLSKTAPIPAGLPIRITTRMLKHDGFEVPFSLDYDSPGPGSYIVSHLAPGDYSINVTWGPGYGPTQPNANLNVTIADRDIDLGTINVGPVRTFTGRVTMVGSDILVPFPLGRVNFQTWDNPLPVGVLAPVAADGTFNVELPEGIYRIRLLNLPSDSYIASVRYVSREVQQVGLTVDRDPEGPILVGIATGVGEVHGVVHNARGDLVAGARVVLSPIENRQANTDLIQVKVTDASGSYSFGNIPPGSYSVVALETILSTYTVTDPNATRNAAFMKQFERQETKVNIGAGERKSLDLRVLANFK